jgi:hypothetical protein
MREADPLTEFERQLAARLLDYSDAFVRSREPADIASRVVADARRDRMHYVRWLTGVAAAAALVAAVAIVLPRVLDRSIGDEPVHSASSVVDTLFDETSTCRTALGGHAVEVTYPATWFTRRCIWFGPDPLRIADPGQAPLGAVITLGAVPSPPLQGSSNEPRRGFVDGLPWTRTFESTTENETRITHLVYYIVLDPAAGEPTMVATTSTASEGDENLNAEVLDRMVERLTFP